MKTELSKFLRKFRWKPKEGIVYKSWYKGNSHFGKSAIVTILFENKQYEGTFKVHNETCEIRVGKGHNMRRLIHPKMSLFQRILSLLTQFGVGRN
jgi:hypothetical protein